MNRIIEKNQGIVKGFYRTAVNIANEKAENNRKYKSDIADTENKKLEAEKESLYNKSREQIISNFNEIKELCSIAGFPTAENITSDSIFFSDKSPIELTAEEVKAYRDKYTDNYTMLRIIKNWLEEKHTGLNDYTDIKHTIHLPLEQLREYAENASTGLGLLATINRNPESISSAVIDTYCGELNKCTTDIIGNGDTLYSKNKTSLPEKTKHLYDFIVLQENQQNYGFNFNHVR